MTTKTPKPKTSKSKNKPRREGSTSEEIEFLRGENRDLRARCQRLARQLKQQQSSIKDDLSDLEDMTKEAVKNRKMSTAIRKCDKCNSGMLEQRLPHAVMFSCMKCNNVIVEKQK